MPHTSEKNETNFTGMRALLWPIHSYEFKKFIPLALIMFCLIFDYTLLRDVKEVLIVKNIGAHVIPYIKGTAVTFSAILFVLIYTKISNQFSQEKIFYIIVSTFLIYFGIFGFILHPNLDYFHPSAEAVAAYHDQFPTLFGFIDMCSNWVITSFYVMAELWGGAMIQLLFWQFANNVVRFTESKRFYGLFAVVANTSLIFSGAAVKYSSDEMRYFFPDGVNTWAYSIGVLMTIAIVMGAASIYLFRWMHTNVLNDKFYFDPEEQVVSTKKKKKPGLLDSMKIIASSPDLLFIALLIIAYGVTINLVEVQWIHQVGLHFKGDEAAISAFLGMFSSATGVFAILFGLFIGSNILRKFSWYTAAIITPAAICISGGLFFLFVCGEQAIMPLIANFSTTPMAIAAYVGAGIIILSKTTKYTLFDPTKEMAYIPLDEELKSKGKAAVDVIGGRLGKGLGGYTQMGLFAIMATKDVIAIAPYAFITFGIIGAIWLFAVKALSIRVANAVKLKEAN